MDSELLSHKHIQLVCRWSQRDDIKAEFKVGLVLVLAEQGYPPVDRDEVYKEIFEQAENFKKYQATTQF